MFHLAVTDVAHVARQARLALSGREAVFAGRARGGGFLLAQALLARHQAVEHLAHLNRDLDVDRASHERPVDGPQPAGEFLEHGLQGRRRRLAIAEVAFPPARELLLAARLGRARVPLAIMDVAPGFDYLDVFVRDACPVGHRGVAVEQEPPDDVRQLMRRGGHVRVIQARDHARAVCHELRHATGRSELTVLALKHQLVRARLRRRRHRRAPRRFPLGLGARGVVLHYVQAEALEPRLQFLVERGRHDGHREVLERHRLLDLALEVLGRRLHQLLDERAHIGMVRRRQRVFLERAVDPHARHVFDRRGHRFVTAHTLREWGTFGDRLLYKVGEQPI